MPVNARIVKLGSGKLGMPNSPSQEDRNATTIWLKPTKPSRDGQALTQQRIVDAAVELLDASGQDGLTMRKLADRLDAGAPSLYWHVETRDDVLELALDSVLGEVSLPTIEDEWTKALTSFLTAWRQTLLRHPWSTSLFGVRPLLGPNALSRSEYLRAILAKSGLSDGDVVHAGYTLFNFLLGSVATQTAWQRGDEAGNRERIASFLRQNASAYPTLSSQVVSENADWDESFSRGLAWIIRALATS